MAASAKRAKLGTHVEMLNERFPALMEQFTSFIRSKYTMPESAIARLSQMFTYTCIGGKLNRGALVLLAYENLAKANPNGDKRGDQTDKACVLAWCLEILQACFLVADDIMDRSETRRGQPCWYKKPEIQLDAINDALILESFLYFLLKTYFHNEPTLYISLVDLFHEVSLQTQLGQMLDLTSQPQGRRDPELLQNFTLSLYKKIVQFKTAFYTFYLSVASALLLSGISEPSTLALAQELSIELGEKFQIQDDYLDCFGDEKLIGKKGTDIMDHKCTWLVVNALERCTPEQRQLLEAHYGKEGAEHEQAVKDLYRTLDLPSLFAKQEEESKARVETLIGKAAEAGVPSAVFATMLDMIHGRSH